MIRTVTTTLVVAWRRSRSTTNNENHRVRYRRRKSSGGCSLSRHCSSSSSSSSGSGQLNASSQSPQQQQLTSPPAAAAATTTTTIQKSLPESTPNSFSSTNPTPRSGRHFWNQPGSILIALGWSGLALVVVDQILQYQQKQQQQQQQSSNNNSNTHPNTSIPNRSRMLDVLAEDRRIIRNTLLDQYQSTPALYTATLSIRNHNVGGLGGTHGLDVSSILRHYIDTNHPSIEKKKKKGEGSQPPQQEEVVVVVDVLREGLGPGGHYCMVRYDHHRHHQQQSGSSSSSSSNKQSDVQVGWYPQALLQRATSCPDQSKD